MMPDFEHTLVLKRLFQIKLQMNRLIDILNNGGKEEN
jgi:hypothetical protein